MTDRQAEERPAEVSERATQAGDIRARWAWVEPSVWTERMLTALETGIKGGKWFSLLALAKSILCQAWVVLSCNGPCSGVSILDEVNHQLESRMREIRLSGSEGGGTELNRFSLPLSGFVRFCNGLY